MNSQKKPHYVNAKDVDHITQLERAVELLKDKYPEISVESRFDRNTAEIILLNGLSGGTDPTVIDPVNVKPIQFFKLYNAKITKELHQHHSYWSNSVIKIDCARLRDIVAALDVMPSADKKQESSRMMARC